MVLTCVLYKIETAMPLAGNGLEAASMQLVGRVAWFVWYAFTAAGIVGTSVIVHGLVNRRPGRRAPGHWLIAGHTSMQLIGLAKTILYQAFYAAQFIQAHPQYSWCFSLVNIVISLLIAAYYVVAATRLRKAVRWIVSFVLLTTVELVEIGSALATTLLELGTHTFWIIMLLPLIWSFATALAIGTVALTDLLRVRRDWVHFLGVVLYATQTLAMVVYTVWLWYHLFDGFGFVMI
jgi:hypothetical protein